MQGAGPACAISTPGAVCERGRQTNAAAAAVDSPVIRLSLCEAVAADPA